jgi:hypothetical protein
MLWLATYFFLSIDAEYRFWNRLVANTDLENMFYSTEGIASSFTYLRTKSWLFIFSAFFFQSVKCEFRKLGLKGGIGVHENKRCCLNVKGFKHVALMELGDRFSRKLYVLR